MVLLKDKQKHRPKKALRIQEKEYKENSRFDSVIPVQQRTQLVWQPEE